MLVNLASNSWCWSSDETAVHIPSINIISDVTLDFQFSVQKTHKMDKVVDPRRKEKVNRYKPRQADADSNPQAEDPMPDYMNILGKILLLLLGLSEI